MARQYRDPRRGGDCRGLDVAHPWRRPRRPGLLRGHARPGGQRVLRQL